jgi:protein tyrosine phosphatase (PTP) superfamily phosphohydrolase (DUF442 family)
MGRFGTFMLLLAAFVCGCAAPAAPAPAAPPTVIVPTDRRPQRPLGDGYVPGVENFGFVSGDLWRGARPTRAGFATLAAMGVRTVIDLELHDDAPADLPPGVRYVSIPTPGWHSDRVDSIRVLAAIRDNPKPVFVHCREGRDRTGMAVAAYRLSTGMSAADAIAELHNFHVHPWWGLFIERRVRELAGK